jgi:hypothetical protein
MVNSPEGIHFMPSGAGLRREASLGFFFCEVDGEVQPGKRISGISKLI